jgi:muramoyltetrapeptide carboxypeptidase
MPFRHRPSANRIAVLTAASLYLILSAACGLATAAERPEMLHPKRLRPGDTVMFIAPAGPPKKDEVLRGKQRIEGLGYNVKMRDDLFDVEGYLAGTDERRAEELMEAFLDDEVDGVLCVRGGYGCMRILDQLDFDKIRQHPKVLLGFSDITALHAALQAKAGLVSFHGPGPASGLGSEKGPTDFTVKSLLQAIDDEVATANPAPGEVAAATGDATSDYTIEVPDSVAKVASYGAGRATGRLVGGNLSLISALEGTPYAIDCRDAILLIEDVNEAPYRIDRMLAQLKLAGKLDKIRGAVLGQFTTEFVREDKLTDDARFDTNGVLAQYFKDAGIPVLVNYPIGHHDQNATVPLGAQVEIDADACTLRVLGREE